MIVCLDSGNTRIKWGAHDGQRWQAQGAVLQAESARLAELVARWPQPARVVLANVAGEQAAARIAAALAAWGQPLAEVQAGKHCCGVTNLYDDPARLGVDRWCALIGARHLLGSAAIVVMAGTAATIDTLDADGNFLGGFILPGLRLMQAALAHGTAGLPLAAGHYATWPRNTDDAIHSGAVEALRGTIERAFGRLPASVKTCLVAGGDAEIIGAGLAVPWRLAHNLPLEGLKEIALHS
jgi:type III pantothenate kinase